MNLATSRLVLLGLRYLASSIPLLSLLGVAIGVGSIFSLLISSISRNPFVINDGIRWSFIGFSLVEVSGFIGLIYSFLLLYALLNPLVLVIVVVNGIIKGRKGVIINYTAIIVLMIVLIWKLYGFWLNYSE